MAIAFFCYNSDTTPKKDEAEDEFEFAHQGIRTAHFGFFFLLSGGSDPAVGDELGRGKN